MLAVAAGLASVLRTLAPEHWIVNLMAVRLARMLRETGQDRSHPLDLIAAEYLQLSCAAAALNPGDYTLSNCNERLAAGWSGYATMLGDEGYQVRHRHGRCTAASFTHRSVSACGTRSIFC